MQSALLMLAAFAGSVVAQSSETYATLPPADAPVTVPTNAATSAPPFTTLKVFEYSSTTSIVLVATAKSVVDSSISSAAAAASSSSTPAITSNLVPTNATGEGPAVTQPAMFGSSSAANDYNAPDGLTAHTLLTSLYPSLTLAPSSSTSYVPAVTPPYVTVTPSVPPPPPSSSPAPSSTTTASTTSSKDDCKKSTTLVTSVRPTTSVKTYNLIATTPSAYPTTPAYPTTTGYASAPTGTGSGYGSYGSAGSYQPWWRRPHDGPNSVKYASDDEDDSSSDDDLKAVYANILAKFAEWQAAGGYN